MKYRISSLPGRHSGNPYIDLFYNSLFPYGFKLVNQLKFDLEWMDANIDTFDCIHLHWPELIWRNYIYPCLYKLRFSDIKGTWRLSMDLERIFHSFFDKKKLEWFEYCLNYLKCQGKKIIYTWHNFEPHENVRKLDYVGNQVLADYSDLIIFHSEWAKEQCRNIYDISCKTVVMHHGNYDGVYPPPRNKNLVAHALGLDPNKPIVGHIGNIRDYKGIDIACKALLTFNGQVQFLCAGNPHESTELVKITQDISRMGGVLVPRKVTEQEYVDYTNVCDFIILPYKKVTGSGALHAALTLKRGVVASDLPYFREILNQSSKAGVLVEPANHQSLAKGIEKYLTVPSETRHEAARALADEYSWDKVIMPVAKAFESVLG